MDQETVPQEEPVQPQATSRNPLLVVLVVIFLGGVAGAVYCADQIHKDREKRVTVLHPNSIVVSSSATPKTATTAYIVAESTDSEATFFKIGVNSQKEKLFSVPTAKDIAITGTLLPDQKTLIYTDKDYNLQSYNLETKVQKLVKAAVPYDDKNKINELYSFTNVLASPDGKKLLVRWVGYECGGVGIMDTDGGNFVRLNGCSGQDFDWSPDSKKFVIADGNNDFGGDPAILYVADTTNPSAGKNILPKNAGKEYPDEYKDVFDPKFSPDGSKIVVGYRYLDIGQDRENETKANSYQGIYMVNTDGSGFKQVSDNQSFSTHPVWKDSTTVVYGLSNYYVGGKKGIYSIAPDGQSNTELFSDATNNMYQPLAISPDGKYVVYMAGIVEKDKNYLPLKSVYLYDFDTKKNALLTTTGTGSFVGWISK